MDDDLDVVFAILEPYFEASREVFARYASGRGLASVKSVRLECRPEIRDSGRHFAGASEDGRIIAVAPEMVDLPEDTVAAIFGHEFGHVVDFLNPARFLRDGKFLLFMPEEDPARLARVRQWEARGEDEVERVADQIAEEALGIRIGYSGPCMLQGLGRGVPRPKGLR